MEKKLLRNIKGYTEFKEKYTFFDCNREYPGWTGEERYTIYADCDVSEIEKEFPEIIAAMSPVLIMPTELKPIRDQYKQNEDKYEKRNKHNQSIFELDEEAERIHPELCVPDFITEMEEQEIKDKHDDEIRNICGWILSKLTETQKRRLILYYVCNKKLKEIAEIEKCSIEAASKSIKNSEKIFSEFYQKGLNFSIPNSMHYEGVDSILERITASIKIENENKEN